jgi:prepilin-type N-terminal cleavage/methylation domain-containing protein
MQKPSSSRAFTLIELMLAIAIAITVTMLAIPNMRGASAERRLHETFERFDALARKAQLYAVREQRSWTLIFDPGRLSLQPDEPLPEEREGGGSAQQEALACAEGESYLLQRHASLRSPKETLAEWTFWRSGTCEPVIVSYDGPDGTWSAQYNPLTGHGEIIDQVIR